MEERDWLASVQLAVNVIAYHTLSCLARVIKLSLDEKLQVELLMNVNKNLSRQVAEIVVELLHMDQTPESIVELLTTLERDAKERQLPSINPLCE